MSNCSSGCPYGDCPSYGYCMRNKGVRTLHVSKTNGVDRDYEKRFNAEIKAYRDAARQGIEPDGSSMAQIDRAVKISEATGVPYKSPV